MGVIVRAAGLLTTVQDGGRTGCQKYGIAPSGAMDRRSLALANILAGNGRNAACLELTLLGPVLEFTEETVIALAGADLGAILDGTPVPAHAALPVRAGSVLSFGAGAASAGCRAYLAVAGGFEVEEVMGSRSTNLRCALGGFEGRALREGDLLPAIPQAALPRNLDRRRLAAADLARLDQVLPGPEAVRTLRFVPGPQADRFAGAAMEAFLGTIYRLSPRSDRQGCRLEGPALPVRGKTDILSDAVPEGGIQIPSDGLPIVMTADRQTTGGYAKIGTVIGRDLPALAQRRPGEPVRFLAVSKRRARALYLEEERMLKRLERKFLGGPR